MDLTTRLGENMERPDPAGWARLWAALGDRGSYNVCGWLKDRFGLSWQINYAGLPDLISGDPQQAERVMGAMMHMRKIDIQALTEAGANRSRSDAQSVGRVD